MSRSAPSGVVQSSDSSPSIFPVLKCCQCRISNITTGSDVNGGCWVELKTLTVCQHYIQVSIICWEMMASRGNCFCVRPDNSLQTYLVLQQDVKVNTKRMWWLNSCLQPQRNSTLKRKTGAKVTAFTFQHMVPQVCSLVVVCFLFSELPVKKYEVRNTKGMLEKSWSEINQQGTV